MGLIHGFSKSFLGTTVYDLFISSVRDNLEQFQKIWTTLLGNSFGFGGLLLRFTRKNSTTVNGSSMATSEEAISGEIPWSDDKKSISTDAYHSVVVAHLSK